MEFRKAFLQEYLIGAYRYSIIRFETDAVDSLPFSSVSHGCSVVAEGFSGHWIPQKVGRRHRIHDPDKTTPKEVASEEKVSSRGNRLAIGDNG